nr:hypothetical protein [Tanacetum cinerariifolium]
MKRAGTGFSRVITSLFENMLVPAAEEVGQAQDDVYIPTEPSTSKPHKKHKSKKQQPIAPKVPSLVPSPEHQLPSPFNDPIPDADMDNFKFQELINLCTILSNNVLELESEVIDIKSSFTARIQKLEDIVDQLEEKNRGRMIADMDEDVEVNLQEAHAKAYNLDLQHLEKVLNMQDIDEEEPAEVEEVLEVVKAAKLMTKSKDKGKGILIEEPKPLKGQAPSDMDEAFTRQLETKLNTNINWNDVVEQVKKSERQNNKVMRYQALKRKPLTEAQARTNMIIYLNNIASFKIDFFKGMTYSEIRPIFEKHYNSIQTFLEEEITVQEKVIEEEGSKRQEGTPLASKLPVVDYQIHHENNKPYYKIIRADGTHKLFLSFITLLKNFNREDLESLWKLVKERFETTEPKNFSDDFLLNILKIMFEKLDIEANQMLDNVRIEIKEESEMSIELLTLVKRQLNEGWWLGWSITSNHGNQLGGDEELAERRRVRREGLDKEYDRFQTLLSQLEIHGVGVLHEDANQKFLRSLHSSWSQVALIMKTKPGLDTLSTTASSSNIQNVAFVFTENTSNTNDVSTAYSVSSLSVLKSQEEGSSSYTDEVIHSFFTNQSSVPQLNYDDLEQINDDDMEEMDLKLQVAMISMRIKKFHKRTGRKLQFDTKDPVGFDKTKVECFNHHKLGHFARDCRAKGNQDKEEVLDDINWPGHIEEDAQNYAMMAYSFSNLGSNNEVKSYSKACEESYARLKKLYDDQKGKLGDASVEITAYTLALKKVEAQLLCHQQNQLAYEQKIRFADGMHAVPPLITGNYMPSGLDVEIDFSKPTYDDPHRALKDKGMVDSACSRHMTENKAHVADYKEFKGGSVAFGGSNGTITDFPFGKKTIGTKWVYRNKKDERGVVVKNKARFVTQGHRQEEGIDYDEVFELGAGSPVLNPSCVPYTGMARSSAATLVAGRGKSHTISVLKGRERHKSSWRGGAVVERARGPGVVLKRRFLE